MHVGFYLWLWERCAARNPATCWRRGRSAATTNSAGRFRMDWSCCCPSSAKSWMWAGNWDVDYPAGSWPVNSCCPTNQLFWIQQKFVGIDLLPDRNRIGCLDRYLECLGRSRWRSIASGRFCITQRNARNVGVFIGVIDDVAQIFLLFDPRPVR